MALRKIQLGYKAFDMHELAVHFVAEHAGLYDEYGLDVELVDTRAVPDGELPEDFFSVACGAALLRWLRGEELKVAFVAVDKPMFLLCARVGITTLDALRGETIAGYPDGAPPAQFLRIVFEDAEFDPDSDVNIEALPGDAERIAQLESGTAAAAVISSATMPFRLEQRGLNNLLCLGDRIRVPSTGLAVSTSLFHAEPLLVAAVRDAHRVAIRRLHAFPDELRAALSANLFSESGDLDAAVALAPDFYSPDGLTSLATIAPGVERVARSLGVATPARPYSLYDCTLRVD